MDTVQWTFMRAIETGFEARSRGEALVWLYRTASRRCLWMLRNRSNRAKLIDRHWGDFAPPPRILEADVVHRALFVQALDAMDDGAAQLVLMTYIWGYTHQRAAALAGTSVRTVGRARAAFEAQLRALVAPEEAPA